MTELVRKNIRMSQKVATWYEDKAKEIGVSQTNLMVIALSEYIKQEKTIDAMSSMENIIEQLGEKKNSL